MKQGNGGTFIKTDLCALTEAHLKVSKFRKQIFLFSFEPKNKRSHFLISDLASKNGYNQKNQGTLFRSDFIILIRGYLT